MAARRKSRHVSIHFRELVCLFDEHAFDTIQGFDENFELYFEDSDLCYRCHEAGWDIDFVSDAKVTHQLGQSTRGTWTLTSLIYQQSHLEYYRKHARQWALGLLKAYLFFKWLRLYYVQSKEKNTRDQAIPYCRAYRRIIFGRGKLTLAQGIPK